MEIIVETRVNSFMKSLTRMALAAALLATCGSAFAQVPAAKGVCKTCGVVESVRFVEKKDEATGLGVVAGGAVGGVLGQLLHE